MSEMASTDPEGMDRVRMTWNTWPCTKVEAIKCVIPLAACISLIRHHPDIPTLPYAPLRCKTCSAALNSFACVDFSAKIWICPFCFQRNHFPLKNKPNNGDTSLPLFHRSSFITSTQLRNIAAKPFEITDRQTNSPTNPTPKSSQNCSFFSILGCFKGLLL